MTDNDADAELEGAIAEAEQASRGLFERALARMLGGAGDDLGAALARHLAARPGSSATLEAELRRENARIIGPSGLLTEKMRLIPKVSKERRRELGQRANGVKQAVEEAFAAALALQWLPALANFAGTRYVGAVQIVATVFKFVPLLLVAVGGLFFFDSANLGPFEASGQGTLGALSASAAILLFSYLGVESAAVSAGEVERALAAGIEAAVVGNRIGDIAHAIGTVCRGAGYGIMEDYGGHGIGRRMHEDPPVPNEGRPGQGHAPAARHVPRDRTHADRRRHGHVPRRAGRLDDARFEVGVTRAVARGRERHTYRSAASAVGRSLNALPLAPGVVR